MCCMCNNHTRWCSRVPASMQESDTRTPNSLDDPLPPPNGFMCKLSSDITNHALPLWEGAFKVSPLLPLHRDPRWMTSCFAMALFVCHDIQNNLGCSIAYKPGFWIKEQTTGCHFFSFSHDKLWFIANEEGFGLSYAWAQEYCELKYF